MRGGRARRSTEPFGSNASQCVARAGPHSVLILGINPARDYAHNRVIIARRSAGALALRIVALVISGLVAIGSLVATLLVLEARS